MCKITIIIDNWTKKEIDTVYWIDAHPQSPPTNCAQIRDHFSRTATTMGKKKTAANEYTQLNNKPVTTSSSSQSYGTTSDDINAGVKAAHVNLDADASRHLHQLKIQMRKDHAHENHMSGGGYIKSAVYGGLDGIITTFATVTSVAGSGLPHAVILILGLAHLVADGLSMGVGDMLSSQAEADLVNHERKREVW